MQQNNKKYPQKVSTNQRITDRLYEARACITDAIDNKNFRSIDTAMDALIQVRADSLTQDVVEPERLGSPIPEVNYEEPEVVVVPNARYKTHGQFKTKTGLARGLVVHYTVSGRGEKNAKGVVNYLANKGLGCPVMDENGIIYVPKGFNMLRDVAYHAGKSKWGDVTGLSYYCIGMEICCWGLDTKKRGSSYRLIESQRDNVKPGKYEKFTNEQERSLVNFIKWLKAVNPEFSTDWVLGHDEIAPNRKTDPGGSLSMTMPKFREYLQGV